MRGPLKAVIFDMDGVLTETSHEHFLAWQALAKELGYVLPEEIKDDVKGISRMASLDIVLEAGNRLELFTYEEKVALATKKNEIYIELIHKFTPDNLSPGAIELLAMLKGNGIKIGLASASRNAPFLLQAMKIESYFDTVVDPNDIHMGKPAPDIFLKAAEQLEVPAESCIGIEDAYAGIESILLAGMVPIGIGDKKLLHNCEDVFESLEAIDCDTITYIWHRD